MATFPIRTEQLSIRSYDVDFTGHLRLSSLLQYFQEIAGHHATELGVGYDHLRQQGMFWVLSRIRIQVAAMPVWGDTVTLETRPIGVHRLFAMREFSMTDGRGAVLLTAATGWLLLDRVKNRPGRIQLLPLAPHLKQETPAPSDFLEKLTPPHELSLRHEKTILPSDLDVNNHVNNAEYVRWIVDALTPEQIAQRPIRTLQVNYLDAALFGETIAISGGPEDHDHAGYYIEGTKKPGEVKVFQAALSWA
jgi:medium-chain acyl-[acyl-carrier-protein] hydrolase